MAPSDEARWLQQARAGNPDAAAWIYAYLRRRLLPYIRRSSPPHLDVEDTLDDTYLAVWGGLKRLRDDDKLLPYARKIADRLIARSRRPSSHAMPCGSPRLLRPGIAEQNVGAEEFLAALLGILNDGELRLFELLYVQGARPFRICLSLRISRTALASRKSRLQAKLRQITRELRQ